MSTDLVTDVFGSDLEESDREQLPPTTRSPVPSARAPIAFDSSDDEEPAPKRRSDSVRKKRNKTSGEPRTSKKRRLTKQEDDFADSDEPKRPGETSRRDSKSSYDIDHDSRYEAEPKDPYDEPQPEDDQEEAPPAKPKNAFERALDENKAMRRPRRVEIDPAKVEAECVSFLEKMMTARDSDIKSYQSGKPALEKLKMLREVELMVMKVSHREQLMDNMLLAIIKAWLDPMPDGALPNVQIRTSLLTILMNIRVDSDWVERLESSQGLGRIVHYLSRKEDHLPNKRMAEKLLMKWARPVYQSNANFHDLLDEFDKPEEGRRAPKEGIVSERRAAMETVKHFRTTQEKINAFKSKTGKGDDEPVLATIPRPTPFLYTSLAPERNQGLDDKQLRELRNAKAKNKKVNRTMSFMRRANKNQSARAAKPSLNGRR